MDVSIRARIEEMVEKAQKEVEAQIREDGENAAMDVGTWNPSGTSEASWTYEIPFKLWTECF